MTTMKLPEYITIHETTVGVRRFYPKCTEHPTWRPGSSYDPDHAEWDIDSHINAEHDGIDRTGMPVQLVTALARITDVNLRRQVARGARDWARRAVIDPAQGPVPNNDRSN